MSIKLFKLSSQISKSYTLNYKWQFTIVHTTSMIFKRFPMRDKSMCFVLFIKVPFGQDLQTMEVVLVRHHIRNKCSVYRRTEERYLYFSLILWCFTCCHKAIYDSRCSVPSKLSKTSNSKPSMLQSSISGVLLQPPDCTGTDKLVQGVLHELGKGQGSNCAVCGWAGGMEQPREGGSQQQMWTPEPMP